MADNSAYQVAGPCDIYSADLGMSGLTIGRTDDDDPVEIRIMRRANIVMANDTGLVPGAAVYAGQMAIITATMTKWDPVAKNEMLTPPGVTYAAQADEGKVGTIGREVIGNDTISLEIRPTIVGQEKWTFGKVYLLGDDAVRVFGLGNDGSLLACVFTAVEYDDSGTRRLYKVENVT